MLSLIMLKGAEFLKLEIFDTDFYELIFRFGFNMFFIIIIVRYLYYPTALRKGYLFTYTLISITVFLICFLLENVKLELGFALGLFAIFGILRYRTSQIPIKEMTYLFLVIGVSVINALANSKISYAELVFANLVVVLTILGFEKFWFLKNESRKTVLYENIEMIQPEHWDELKKDLEKRTGLKIHRFEIGNMDFLRDSVRIRIFYYTWENKMNFSDNEEMEDLSV